MWARLHTNFQLSSDPASDDGSNLKAKKEEKLNADAIQNCWLELDAIMDQPSNETISKKIEEEKSKRILEYIFDLHEKVADLKHHGDPVKLQNAQRDLAVTYKILEEVGFHSGLLMLLYQNFDTKTDKNYEGLVYIAPEKDRQGDLKKRQNYTGVYDSRDVASFRSEFSRHGLASHIDNNAKAVYEDNPDLKTEKGMKLK